MCSFTSPSKVYKNGVAYETQKCFIAFHPLYDLLEITLMTLSWESTVLQPWALKPIKPWIEAPFPQI